MSGFQRAHERIPVAGEVEGVLLHQGQQPAISVMNLSRSGAALMADEPIGSVPERAELRMRARESGEWVSCPCELRYILGENRPDGEPAWLHGVLFVEVTDEVQAFIEAVTARSSAG